jgi:CRP/FNR family cyclic AMP-dependent transcriptional regulator
LSWQPVRIGRTELLNNSGHSFDTSRVAAFNFPAAEGFESSVSEYRPLEMIFRQGEACDRIHYLQAGGVKLSVKSQAGRQAVVAMLHPGDFFGEACLSGATVHARSATATSASRVLTIGKDQMLELLQTQRAMSDRFIGHLLARSIRVEEDLIDQLVYPAEKRLARTLILLARSGRPDPSTPGGQTRILPPITQATLAEMVGTTRSRVSLFMRKFARLGLIDTRRGLRVHPSLIALARHE